MNLSNPFNIIHVQSNFGFMFNLYISLAPAVSYNGIVDYHTIITHFTQLTWIVRYLFISIYILIK